MGYKKPTEVTKAFLKNQPLPNHGKSYTVISHKRSDRQHYESS